MIAGARFQPREHGDVKRTIPRRSSCCGTKENLSWRHEKQRSVRHKLAQEHLVLDIHFILFFIYFRDSTELFCPSQVGSQAGGAGRRPVSVKNTNGNRKGRPITTHRLQPIERGKTPGTVRSRDTFHLLCVCVGFEKNST